MATFPIITDGGGSRTVDAGATWNIRVEAATDIETHSRMADENTTPWPGDETVIERAACSCGWRGTWRQRRPSDLTPRHSPRGTDEQWQTHTHRILDELPAIVITGRIAHPPCADCQQFPCDCIPF